MMLDALDARRRRPGRDPLPTRRGAAGRRARRRVGPARRGACAPGDGRVCVLGDRQDGRGRRQGRRRGWPSAGTRSRCGTCAAAHHSTSEMIAAAAAHDLVVTVEDGVRDGGIGMAIADACGAPAPVHASCRSACPAASSPTARRPQIIAQLGLDADGIERTDPRTSRADTPACSTTSTAELDLALELADLGRRVHAAALRRPGLRSSEWKDDRTEVTEADRGTEIADRAIDPGAPAPTTPCSARSTASSATPTRRGAGSSTRSTARPASCAASRCGRR